MPSVFRPGPVCLLAFAAVLAAGASGCSLFRSKPVQAHAAPRTRMNSAAQTNQVPLIVAATTSGKVAAVNQQGRFAVIIFPIGSVPPVNTRMVVYHGDAKAGEVKITGPTQENLTVGDIVLGTVQENDDVRGE